MEERRIRQVRVKVNLVTFDLNYRAKAIFTQMAKHHVNPNRFI